MLFDSFTVFRKQVVSSKNSFVDFSVVKSMAIMDSLSKAFTYCRKAAGIEKDMNTK
jgi:hypothetical protein